MGYATVVEFLGTLPDIVAIERPSEKDWLLRSVDVVATKAKSSPQGVKGSNQNQYGRAGKKELLLNSINFITEWMIFVLVVKPVIY